MLTTRWGRNVRGWIRFAARVIPQQHRQAIRSRVHDGLVSLRSFFERELMGDQRLQLHLAAPTNRRNSSILRFSVQRT